MILFLFFGAVCIVFDYLQKFGKSSRNVCLTQFIAFFEAKMKIREYNEPDSEEFETHYILACSSSLGTY